MTTSITQQAEEILKISKWLNGLGGSGYNPTAEEKQSVSDAAGTLLALKFINFDNIYKMLMQSPPNDKTKLDEWYRALEFIKALRDNQI